MPRGHSSLFDGPHALLPRALTQYVLPPLSNRGLVLGMGGGCDVFAAYALSQAWSQQEVGSCILYGNCIGQRTLADDHEKLGPHLFCCPPSVAALQAGDEAYGTTRLEQSVPRGVEGSPLLFMVPSKGGRDADIERVTAANTEAICDSLRQLNVDIVLAVDLGGDSLTGGVDFDGGEPYLI